MGFLSFFALGEGVRGDVWVDRFENGAKLRVGGLSPTDIGVKISPSFGTFNPDSRGEERRVSAFDQVSHKGTSQD
jgi:hypothetical protein